MVESTILFTFHQKCKVLELSICEEKGDQKHLIDSSMVSLYAIIYGDMCSKEYKESTTASKSQKGSWLDTLIEDMDT